MCDRGQKQVYHHKSKQFPTICTRRCSLLRKGADEPTSAFSALNKKAGSIRGKAPLRCKSCRPLRDRSLSQLKLSFLSLKVP